MTSIGESASSGDAERQEWLNGHLYRIPEDGMSCVTYWLKFTKNDCLVDAGRIPMSGDFRPASRIFLTHSHADHILALKDLRVKEQAKVFISREEEPGLNDAHWNLSGLMGRPLRLGSADGIFSDGDYLDLGDDCFFKVLLTPGHTSGSCCFLLLRRIKSDAVEDVPMALFSGDTLFQGDVGRCDLPGGDFQLLRSSLGRLCQMAADWPENLPVYPGHGPATTIGCELTNNPWLVDIGREKCL